MPKAEHINTATQNQKIDGKKMKRTKQNMIKWHICLNSNNNQKSFYQDTREASAMVSGRNRRKEVAETHMVRLKDAPGASTTAPALISTVAILLSTGFFYLLSFEALFFAPKKQPSGTTTTGCLPTFGAKGPALAISVFQISKHRDGMAFSP